MTAPARSGPSPTGLLIRATTLSYLGLMVVLPLAALSVQAAEPGVAAFWAALTNPFAWHALKLTFATALVMVLINAVTGTATAWVLVRYSFPGKAIMNALMALPFGMRVLSRAVLESARQDDRLCAALGISGWHRLRLIDAPQLRKPIGLCLALAASLAVGDLSAIALFGRDGMATLPLLLFQQMGAYRMEAASITALLLLAMSLALFALIERMSPQEVINDPQLRANDIVVPLEGAGDKLTSTISSPIQVHGVNKVPARRAPEIGEHNEEVLRELGFDVTAVKALQASGAVPVPQALASKRG